MNTNLPRVGLSAAAACWVLLAASAMGGDNPAQGITPAICAVAFALLAIAWRE